jgi:hypothetical protein
MHVIITHTLKCYQGQHNQFQTHSQQSTSQTMGTTCVVRTLLLLLASCPGSDRKLYVMVDTRRRTCRTKFTSMNFLSNSVPCQSTVKW